MRVRWLKAVMVAVLTVELVLGMGAEARAAEYRVKMTIDTEQDPPGGGRRPLPVLRPGQWVVVVGCDGAHTGSPECSGVARHKWLSSVSKGVPAFFMYFTFGGWEKRVLEETLRETLESTWQFSAIFGAMVGVDSPFKVYVHGLAEAERKDVFTLQMAVATGPFESMSAATEWVKTIASKPDGVLLNAMAIHEFRGRIESERRVVSPIKGAAGRVTSASCGNRSCGFAIRVGGEGGEDLEFSHRRSMHGGPTSESDEGKTYRVDYREITYSLAGGGVLGSELELVAVRPGP